MTTMTNTMPNIPALDLSKVPLEEREATMKKITEWSERWDLLIEQAATTAMDEVGVSPLSGEDLKKQGSLFFFGGSVAAAIRAGVSVDELVRTIQMIDQVRKDEG